jgi:tRNA pseudouridine38-40 synthase
MRNILLTIAYLGTRYCGWQVQPNAVSVSSELIDAIAVLTGEHVKLYGSGRTDAGVHAYGQTANFHTNATIPTDKFAYALNAHLPDDIVVVHAAEVPEEFHARYDAVGKLYEYKVHYAPFPSPFLTDRAWNVRKELDLNAMESACAVLIGEHDFAALMASGSFVKDTVRTLYDLHFDINGEMITFYAKGNGFLYNMVRIIVGSLIQIGTGKLSSADLKEALQSADRTKAGITAPAQGLYLKEVYYDERQFSDR